MIYTTRILQKLRRGQNTAEYILMLVLVSGSALFAFKKFGGVIIERFNAMIHAMQGVDYKESPITDLDGKHEGWNIDAFNEDVKSGNGGTNTPSPPR